MNFKRILGIVIVVIGIVLMCFAFYIKQQVASGEAQVSSAQKKVDKTDSLLSMSPYTKQVGKGLTGDAQKQIDAGKTKISEYTSLSNGLLIGGIVVIVVGAATIILGGNKRGRRSR